MRMVIKKSDDGGVDVDDDDQYGDDNDDMHIEFDPMMIDVVYDEGEIVSRW